MSELRPRYRARLTGAVAIGALAGAASSVALGFGLRMAARLNGDETPANAFREFLSAGGWGWIPLWTGAAAALTMLKHAPSAQARAATAVVSIALASLPLFFKPAYVELEANDAPRTTAAKRRAILKWSYRSPGMVGRIVALSRDPDPEVREQAVLALGVNVVVSDIEQANDRRPSRWTDHPMRDTLRVRLLEALRDPSEPVRAEAARALWKAPRTFGSQPVAAETLAAVLARADRPQAVERLTWLALDAAAGAPHPGLRAAAARFASTTRDTSLARVASRALEPR